VIFPDGFKLDVATARTEHNEYPAAMPIITLGSIRLDLLRRDFTVNALAIRLNRRSFGQSL
jgi:tRNA nucleotidyltransferase (CCA-adding enzyme)